MKRVIITADDFGLALPVNQAIELAHRRGILTTTSLMVGAPYAADAVTRARYNPNLRVGLHLAVCEAMPVLPPSEIPDLVDERGVLLDPIRAALTFIFLPRARRQLEAEIRAQFAAFAATGLALDHVNGHNNMQLHPVVLPLLIEVAREYSARAVRLSFEPLIASHRAAKSSGTLPEGAVRGARAPSWLRFVEWLGMRPWTTYVKWRYRRAGFVLNDYLFGIYDCGSMDLDLLLGVVKNLPEGVSEIHCHPSVGRSSELDHVTPHYQHEAEFHALVSPLVAKAFADCSVDQLSGYSDLVEAMGT